MTHTAFAFDLRFDLEFQEMYLFVFHPRALESTDHLNRGFYVSVFIDLQLHVEISANLSSFAP